MQQLRLLPILLLIFLASNGCKEGPQVSVCVSDPSMGVLHCYNEATQQAFTVTYADSDKYVCFNQTDAKSLLDYCSQDIASGTK